MPADELLSVQEIRVQARLQPGDLTSDDIAVELYFGRLNADGEIVDATSAPMEPVSQSGSWYLYQTALAPRTGSGMHGFTARALCRHRNLIPPFIPGIITWSTSA